MAKKKPTTFNMGWKFLIVAILWLAFTVKSFYFKQFDRGTGVSTANYVCTITMNVAWTKIRPNNVIGMGDCSTLKQEHIQLKNLIGMELIVVECDHTE